MKTKLKKHSPAEMVRLCFALLLLYKQQYRIHMPRGLMNDLEGEVIGEEVHEGGLENRLGAIPQGFESLPLRQKVRKHPHLRVLPYFFVVQAKAIFATVRLLLVLFF